MWRKKRLNKRHFKIAIFCISLGIILLWGPSIVDALGLSNKEYILQVQQQESSLFQSSPELNTIGTYSEKQSNPGGGNGNGNGNGGGNGGGNGKDKP
jgi:uncharacterized membrane protein YgcG